jgi:hypothetical protein
VVRELSLLLVTPPPFQILHPYMDPLNHIQIELLRRHRVGATDERIVQGIHLTINGIAGKLAHLKQGASAGWLYAVVTRPTANFTRLDPGRPEIAILVDAMLRAREVVAARPWSTSQEAMTEHWWVDVLADPRARILRGRRGFYDRHGRKTAQTSDYRLADEPSPVIEVACSKCEWKGGVSAGILYGEEYPLPNLLDHLAMPGCTKIKSQWV